MDSRGFWCLEVSYTLMGPSGRLAPNDQVKTWYFEVPEQRAVKGAWSELVHRIFYDGNAAMHEREPDDPNWLGLTGIKPSPISPGECLAISAGAPSGRSFPWHQAFAAIVWEPGACFYVDDEGRYDTLHPSDFTELMVWRQFEAGRVDASACARFLEGYYDTSPDKARQLVGAYAERLANIGRIHPTDAYRRPPGAQPLVCSPRAVVKPESEGPPVSPGSLRALLVAFGNKEASLEEVMRAIVAHDDWYVQAYALPKESRRNLVDVGGSYTTLKEIIAYTDVEALREAARLRVPLGIMAGGVSSTELLDLLEPERIQTLYVNPKLPQNQRWIIDRPHFELVRRYHRDVVAARSRAQMSTTLFIERDGESDSGVALLPGFYTLGRDPSCDILLRRQGTAREHARLWVEEGEATLCVSHHGGDTFVNGERMGPGSEVVVQEGDMLALGRDELRLVMRPDWPGAQDHGPRAGDDVEGLGVLLRGLTTASKVAAQKDAIVAVLRTTLMGLSVPGWQSLFGSENGAIMGRIFAEQRDAVSEAFLNLLAEYEPADLHVSMHNSANGHVPSLVSVILRMLSSQTRPLFTVGFRNRNRGVNFQFHVVFVRFEGEWKCLGRLDGIPKLSVGARTTTFAPSLKGLRELGIWLVDQARTSEDVLFTERLSALDMVDPASVFRRFAPHLGEKLQTEYDRGGRQRAWEETRRSLYEVAHRQILAVRVVVADKHDISSPSQLRAISAAMVEPCQVVSLEFDVGDALYMVGPMVVEGERWVLLGALPSLEAPAPEIPFAATPDGLSGLFRCLERAALRSPADDTATYLCESLMLERDTPMPSGMGTREGYENGRSSFAPRLIEFVRNRYRSYEVSELPKSDEGSPVMVKITGFNDHHVGFALGPIAVVGGRWRILETFAGHPTLGIRDERELPVWRASEGGSAADLAEAVRSCVRSPTPSMREYFMHRAYIYAHDESLPEHFGPALGRQLVEEYEAAIEEGALHAYCDRFFELVEAGYVEVEVEEVASDQSVTIVELRLSMWQGLVEAHCGRWIRLGAWRWLPPLPALAPQRSPAVSGGSEALVEVMEGLVLAAGTGDEATANTLHQSLLLDPPAELIEALLGEEDGGQMVEVYLDEILSEEGIEAFAQWWGRFHGLEGQLQAGPSPQYEGVTQVTKGDVVLGLFAQIEGGWKWLGHPLFFG